MNGFRKSILWSSLQLHAADFTGADNGFDLTQWQDFSWADELHFILDFQAEGGVISAGSISAKFQYAIPHKTGGFEFGQQRLQVYSTGANSDESTYIAEGVGFPSPIVAHSGAFPTTVRRTILRPGVRCNLRVFTPTPIVGGGYFQVSATLLQRGSL